MKAAQDVMDKINSGELKITTANRAVAGIKMHLLFAAEIKLMHIPGVEVEEALRLGDVARYGLEHDRIRLTSTAINMLAKTKG